MQPILVLASLFATIVFASFTQAFSTGSPVCNVNNQTMVTNMGGNGTTDLGYRLALNATSYKPGDVVAMIVLGNVTFKGILVWSVVPSNPATRLGQWILPNANYKLSTFCDITGGTFTHSNPNPKTPGQVMFLWKAPFTPSGNVSIRAAIALSRTEWQILQPAALTGSGEPPSKNATNPINNTTSPNTSTPTDGGLVNLAISLNERLINAYFHLFWCLLAALFL